MAPNRKNIRIIILTFVIYLLTLWNFDGDLGPFRRMILDIQSSIQRFNYRFADWQSDAGSFILCCVKWIKNLFEMFGRNSRTAVNDEDHHEFVFFFGDNLDGAVFLYCFHCILDQIDQRSLKSAGISGYIRFSAK